MQKSSKLKQVKDNYKSSLCLVAISSGHNGAVLQNYVCSNDEL
jgi:hypothetical protein